MTRGSNPAGAQPSIVIRVSRLLAALLLPLVAAVIAMPAAASLSSCAESDEIQRILDRDYDEHRIASGVTSTGMLIEVFSTDTGSTWTILLTAPEGTSCIVAEGEGWRDLMALGVGV